MTGIPAGVPVFMFKWSLKNNVHLRAAVLYGGFEMNMFADYDHCNCSYTRTADNSKPVTRKAHSVRNDLTGFAIAAFIA